MSNILCDICDKEMQPDMTGELRCKPCDDFTDEILSFEREEAIINGELDG